MGWASDFSYEYFIKILETIESIFEPCLFSSAVDLSSENHQKPLVFMRHDVDVSLRKALTMAEIEFNHCIPATYMIMINSPLYSLSDIESRKALRQLIDMGHEVGLHLDFNLEKDQINLFDLESKIAFDCRVLEDALLFDVRSISFHRPIPSLLRGPLLIAEKINAYSAKLMKWYLSDSKGNWREGEPLPSLVTPKGDLLQLLIHPIWWGRDHMSPEDRLQEYFEAITRGYLPEYVNAIDQALANQLSIRRSGWTE